jgi:hypothetical protein
LCRPLALDLHDHGNGGALSQYVRSVVQSFQKIPVLAATGPNSPAFITAQLVTAAILIIGGVLATRRFKPAGVLAA